MHRELPNAICCGNYHSWFSVHSGRVLTVLVSLCVACALSQHTPESPPAAQCQVEIVNATSLNMTVSYRISTQRVSVGVLQPDDVSVIGVPCGMTVSVYGQSNAVRPMRGLVTARVNAKAVPGESVKAVLRPERG